MKKISIMLFVIILILTSSLTYAQGVRTSGHTGMNPADFTKDKIEKPMRTLIEMGLLYKMLERPAMVAVDGGIIVAYGNKLIKYDKDLNIITQVDMQIDVDGMQELASKLAKKYSGEFMDMMGSSAGYPGLLNAKMSANDALAKATLRAMSTAAESYKTANGAYPVNEAALTSATPPYLNTGYCANSPVAGYYYDCKGMSYSGYTITATPMTVGSTGTTEETITTGGILTP